MPAVTVFCAAVDIDERYVAPAEEFAALLAHNNFTLVWGGSDSGLMSRIATAAQNAQGKIVGVSVEFLAHKARKNADKMTIAKSLPERKKLLLENGDAIVVMVGGIGTIDEVMEVLERKKHNHHNKPIVFLNTDGFYDGLESQFKRMDAEGFLPKPLDELIHFATTPQEAFEYLKSIIL